MGKYTIHNDKNIDYSLDKNFSIIVQKIIEIIGISNIKAIVLFGSFGRGEGGIIIENNKVIPVNDLDITIFVKKNLTRLRKLYSQNLEDNAQILSKKIGVKQIDLDLSHPHTLLFSKMNNANYERYYGHQILFGDIDIKKRMLKPSHKKIKLIDGATYFLTRGSGLVLARYCLDKFKNNNQKVLNQNFYIEINKAILAIGDSYLIKHSKYHYLYSERLKTVENLMFNDILNGNKIKSLYIEALIWKLKPVFRDDTYEIQSKEWYNVVNIYSEYFLWFESERLNINFTNWNEYFEKIFLIQKPDYNMFFRKTVLRILSNPTYVFKIFRPNNLDFNGFAIKLSIMTQILFSVIDKRNSTTLISNARKSLLDNYEIKTQNNWLEISESYLEIFHPNGLINLILNTK